MIVPVVVNHKNESEGETCTSYAMLDNQSNSCLISDTLADSLEHDMGVGDLGLNTSIAQSLDIFSRSNVSATYSGSQINVNIPAS